MHTSIKCSEPHFSGDFDILYTCTAFIFIIYYFVERTTFPCMISTESTIWKKNSQNWWAESPLDRTNGGKIGEESPLLLVSLLELAGFWQSCASTVMLKHRVWQIIIKPSLDAKCELRDCYRVSRNGVRQWSQEWFLESCMFFACPR